MKYAKSSHSVGTTVLIFIMMVGFSHISVLSAHGHGGKTHSEETFTAFQAVQKAIQLYDRLIAAGKLSEGWETGLKTIKISTRKTTNKSDIMASLYILGFCSCVLLSAPLIFTLFLY